MTCAATFARVARDVKNRSSIRYDKPVRRFIRANRDPRLDPVSTVLVGVTAPGVAVALTIALAFAVRRRGVHAWLPIAISPAVAMTADALFTNFLPQQVAPGTREPSFPSGHTTGVTAETLIAAYVLYREGVVDGREAMIACLFPVVAGSNRLYRDRHWASDIVAAWLAGTTIAAACAILYESLAGRNLPGVANSSETPATR